MPCLRDRLIRTTKYGAMEFERSGEIDGATCYIPSKPKPAREILTDYPGAAVKEPFGRKRKNRQITGPRSGHSQHTSLKYVAMTHNSRMLDRELKKGSAELLILALVEDEPRHGYDIARLIELRSHGVIQFKVASLYPLLYRLEARKWIQGRWVEKAGQRRRRYYRLTPEGRRVLAAQRSGWEAFARAIARVAGVQHA